MVNEERISMLMRTLKISREEALELEAYDDDVNKNKKTQYDLTEEQRENVKALMRRTEHKKSNVYRARKPNELKEAIVAELAEFLAEDAQGQAYEDIQVTNKNRMIHFVVGEKEFDLQLIEKRAPKS